MTSNVTRPCNRHPEGQQPPNRPTVISKLLPLAVFPLVLSLSGQGEAGVNAWTSVGGPEGGPVEAIAIHPTNPSVIYACTFGGVFKSTDAGMTWTIGTAGYACYSDVYGCALAIDPVTQTTVYASRNGALGVCKSTDGGSAWSVNTAPSGMSGISALAVNPGSPNVVYAAGGSAYFYRSTDGGVTWSPSNSGLTGSVGTIAVDPSNSAILYAGGNGLFKSINGGASWSPTAISGVGVRAVAVDPLTPTTLYASRGSNGVYKSTDGGTTFNPTGQASYVSQIAIDATNPTTIYAASNTLYGPAGPFKSSDGGATWSTIAVGLGGAAVLALAVDPTAGTNLYLGGDNYFGGSAGATAGLYKSANGGATWNASNTGMRNAWTYVIAVHPTSPTTMFAATGNGVFKTVDSGTSWTVANAALKGSNPAADLVIDPLTPSTLYAAASNGVWKSTDSGTSWTLMNTGLPSYARRLAIDPTVPSTLYAATGSTGVFRTTDGGASWTGINTGLPNPLPYIQAFAIDPVSPSVVYAGAAATTGVSIYKTTDGGASWTAMGLASERVYSLAVDPMNPTTVYAGLGGYSPISGLRKSTDGGATWNVAMNGLPSSPVYRLLIDPLTPTTLYVGGPDMLGVFKSTDGAGNWSALGSGLAPPRALSLAMRATDPTTLFAGTGGGGVFSIEQVATAAPTQSSTATGTPTETPTSTQTPPNTATATPTETATHSPTDTVTETPADTPTDTPAATPTVSPTPTPPPATCPASPASGCLASAKGLVLLKDNADDTKDKFLWKFGKGPALAQGDFGIPTGTTSYALCVYDDGALAMQAQVGPSATLWEAVGSKGWQYKDLTGTLDGVTKAKLLGGGAGKSKAQVKGKGVNVPLPTPVSGTQFFNATTSVQAQLHGSNGACYETAFTPAEVIKNDGRQFKAKF